MLRLLSVLGLLAFTVIPSAAQSRDTRPASTAEFAVGYAGFADDATIDHAAFGGALRFYLSPRIGIGPELQYMRGPRDDRDVIFTGNLTFDMLPPDHRVTPFLVVGGGLFRHSDTFGSQTFSSTEGAFTAGGGVRGWVTDRVYVGGDFRIGWELHFRIAGFVGVSLGR
jgi:hypothetical protein